MSVRRLAQLRASLPYTGGQAKIVLRRMIRELEAELSQSRAKLDSGETVPDQLSRCGDGSERRATYPKRAAVADPEPKPGREISPTGSSSEAKARRSDDVDRQNPVHAGEAGGSPALAPRGDAPSGAVLDPVRRDPAPSAGREGEDSGQLQPAPRFGDWLIKAFGELGIAAKHGELGVIFVDGKRMSQLVAQEHLEKLQRRRERLEARA